MEPNQPNPLLEAALKYAALGWYVAPLHVARDGKCSCGKPAIPPDSSDRVKFCGSAGKHPRVENGSKDASNDPRQIREWWTRWPDANIAVATGQSGLFVVDIDTRKDGDATWNAIAAKYGKDQLETTRCSTGNGMHFYYLNHKDEPEHNSAEGLGKGIDTRGLGGYVVAPPSLHANGKNYAWIEGSAPWDRAPAPMPACLMEVLAETRGRKGGSGLVPKEIGERIPKGRRDSTLLSIAASLRARAIPQAQIEATILSVNRLQCDPPQDEEQVLDICRRYAGKPSGNLKFEYWCPNCFNDTLDQRLPAKWVCHHASCKKTVTYPPWIAKRLQDGAFEDVTFSSKILHDVNEKLKRHPNKDDALNDVMRELAVPVELEDQLREHIEKLRRGGRIRVDGNRQLDVRDDAIYMMVDSGRSVNEFRVIAQPFQVRKRVDVEGKVKAVVEMHGGIVVDNMPGIYKRLADQFQVLDGRYARDVLSLIVNNAENHTRGYTVYAAATDGDKLFMPDEIYPEAGLAKEKYDPIAPFVDIKPTPEDFDNYWTLMGKFHPYEALPAMCLAAISPFAPILRKHRIMVPHVYHLSRTHGVGKSTIAFAVSSKLWKQVFQTAEALESKFRYAAHIDAAALPVVADEALNFKFEVYGDMLKQAAENDICTARGNTDQEIDQYHSRGLCIFTSNSLKRLESALIIRFLLVHYDELRVVTDQAKSETDDLLQRLQPIGPALAQAVVELAEGKESKLLHLVMKEYMPQLQAAYKHWVDRDVRRAQAWAVVYLGLVVWNRASAGRCKLLTIEEFVRDVVAPVEDSTRRLLLVPIRNFISWHIRTMSKYTNQVSGQVRGEEVLWRAHILEAPGVPKLTGWLITAELLDDHNVDHKENPAMQIGGLAEVVTMVNREFKIPLEVLNEQGGPGWVRKFGGKSRRSVFIPDPEDMDAAQGRLMGSAKNGASPPSAPPPTSQLDRARLVVNVIRELSQGRENGVGKELVVSRLAMDGLEQPDVDAAIQELLTRGSVYQPRHEHYLPL